MIKCVIFVDGIDVGLPKQASYEDLYHFQWNRWTNHLASNVGVAAYAAADGYSGMNWLHRILRGLVQNGFDGSVTVVGHSNGAAALFLYFAFAEKGQFSGDRIIDRFVAFDAPTSPDMRLAIATTLWSGWNPWFTITTASRYIQQHHIVGLYAWEAFDPVSGDVFGEGYFREKGYFDLSWDPHLYLEEYPSQELLNAL